MPAETAGKLRDDLRQALEQFLSIGVGLLETIVVLAIASLIARASRRVVRRRLQATLAPENAKRIVENIVTVAVYVGGITLLLTIWGVTWTTLLAAIGVSTLVVALGMQSVLQSFVAGIVILFQRPYNVGDYISFSGHDIEGKVEEIDLRTTIIRVEDGTRVVAPNSFLFSQAVLNHSPERAELTVITVHGASLAGWRSSETQPEVTAALNDIPGFTITPDVVVRSRFARVHVPTSLARFSRLSAWVAAALEKFIDQTTEVRVSWYGLTDQVMREAVILRLNSLFPDARVTVRRW